MRHNWWYSSISSGRSVSLVGVKYGSAWLKCACRLSSNTVQDNGQQGSTGRFRLTVCFGIVSHFDRCGTKIPAKDTRTKNDGSCQRVRRRWGWLTTAKLCYRTSWGMSTIFGRFIILEEKRRSLQQGSGSGRVSSKVRASRVQMENMQMKLSNQSKWW